MNSRLILLALPLVFFACEADADDPTLVGTWNATAFDEYSGATCTGTPGWTLDSTKAIFGDDVTLTVEFTEDQSFPPRPFKLTIHVFKPLIV